jgi:aryl-alcohol dehydrogenase-like predicted oxidoreductase
VRTRPLGGSGLEVPVVGLGCNAFGRRVDLEGTRRVIDAAIDAGVTFLDTADIYGGAGTSETMMGEVLAGRRDRVLLATKFGMDMGDGKGPRGSRAYLRDACEASLRRLRTDVIDVYQYHEPDGVTPLAETLGAMRELVGEGKVRAIGVSNFSAAELEEAAPFGIASLQNEYSLMAREIEADVLPACERLGVGVLPYFPLARGLLTGKYKRGEEAAPGQRLSGTAGGATDAQLDVLDALERFAAERGIGLLDVAIGGLAAQPAVACVISGATKPEQVHANAAAGGWEPSAEDLAALDAIVPRGAVVS